MLKSLIVHDLSGSVLYKINILIFCQICFCFTDFIVCISRRDDVYLVKYVLYCVNDDLYLAECICVVF